jgi:hypothetical protein
MGPKVHYIVHKTPHPNLTFLSFLSVSLVFTVSRSLFLCVFSYYLYS